MNNPDSGSTETLKTSVFEFLKIHCLGGCQAVKAEDMAVSFQTSMRTINDIVRLLRKDGFLIGSSKGRHPGYYIPVTDYEINEYLADFKAEIFDMLQTYNRQKRAKKQYLDSRTCNDLFAGQDLHRAGTAGPGPVKMGVPA
jgi:hypothetical protein